MSARVTDHKGIVAALRRFDLPPLRGSVRVSGNGIVFRFPDPARARRILSDRRRFRQGPLGILHGAQVGGLDTEFRSCRKGRELSLHVVLGRSGLAFADLDRYNPYQNLSSLLLHGFVELAPHLLRRIFRLTLEPVPPPILPVEGDSSAVR